MRITKIFTVESSHTVAGAFSTKCQNLHGHSYKIHITLSGSKLDKSCMLMDFSVLKGSIKQFIESIDHAYMINSYVPEEQKNFIKNMTNRWVELPFNATAEMMTIWFHKEIQNILNHTVYNFGAEDIKVDSVTVWETSTGCAQSDPTDVKNIWVDGWDKLIIYSEESTSEWSDDLKKLLIGKEDIKIHIDAPTNCPMMDGFAMEH